MATTEPDGLLVWPPTTVPDDFCYKRRDVTRLILPDVINIGYEAFMASGLAGTLDLPSVRTIEYQGFRKCTDLTDVQMPNLQKVGAGGFLACTSLRSVNMPKVRHLGRHAFDGCVGLTAISLPLVEEVPEGVCAHCTSLKEVRAPKATMVKIDAFRGCFELTIVSLPSATNIDAYAFLRCSNLERVELPKVTQMVSQSFAQCRKLRYLSVPELIDISSDRTWLKPFEDCSRDLVIDLGARPELSALATSVFDTHTVDPGWEVRSRIDVNGALFSVRSKWAGAGAARHEYGTTVAVSFMDGDVYDVVVDGRIDLRAAVLASDEIAAGQPDLATANWGFIKTYPTDNEPAVVRDSFTGEELFQLAQAGYSLDMTVWYNEDGGSPSAKRVKRAEAAFVDLCIK